MQLSPQDRALYHDLIDAVKETTDETRKLRETMSSVVETAIKEVGAALDALEARIAQIPATPAVVVGDDETVANLADLHDRVVALEHKVRSALGIESDEVLDDPEPATETADPAKSGEAADALADAGTDRAITTDTAPETVPSILEDVPAAPHRATNPPPPAPGA